MPTITDELLTRADLMKLFKVSQPTVLRLEAAGKLLPIRIGSRVRFKRADVEQYINDSLTR
ncbi:MAG: helix-turn-helix domain-containing protein [Candidatus Sulfotelmatobacter sp.]